MKTERVVIKYFVKNKKSETIDSIYDSLRCIKQFSMLSDDLVKEIANQIYLNNKQLGSNTNDIVSITNQDIVCAVNNISQQCDELYDMFFNMRDNLNILETVL